MNDNTKKYRRSAVSIACYVVAVLMLFYVIYMAGNTVSQINQYYAQYDMKAQPMEYVTYILQTVLEPLINAAIFFMFGYVLDEVRKNNSAYYLSDEEIEEAKIAKKEARIAKRAAAGETAAAKAGNITTTEQSVEADFARSLDEELSKDAEKKAPKKKEPEPEQEDDEETEEVDYHSMKAMDLYKLCQKRGIEAEPKHRTKYYITLLEKADQEAETPAESSDDDDDDDWDI